MSQHANTSHPRKPLGAAPGLADKHLFPREAFRAVAVQGWDTPAGDAVLAALSQRAKNWATALDRRAGRRPGATAPEDVVTAAWEALSRFGERVAAADCPWSYLWTTVRHALAAEHTADELLSHTAARTVSRHYGHAAVRVGLDAHLLVDLDVSAPSEPSPPRPAIAIVAAWLAADGDAAFWTEVLDHALEVMATARRSYEEHALRRDTYLLDTLELTPDELSALAALLLGPRRGDRDRQSVLLALHRDPSIPLDSIPGATRRRDILLARRHPGRTLRRTATTSAAA